MTVIATFTPNPALDLSTSIDQIVPTRKLRCSPARRDPGGGGINVARVIKRLGRDVTAVFPRGGATGYALAHLIEQQGVAIAASEIAEETREDFAVHEDKSGKQYRFVLPGPTLSEAEWQACLDLLASLTPRPDYLVASGSLPPGVPADFYARAARIAKSRDARFVLDSSGLALAAALEEGVFLFKPDLGELTELIGEELEDEVAWIGACEQLIKRKQAEVVALTLGSRGALLVARDLILRAEALSIEPLSAIGAGDSFLGGMVWGLGEGLSLEHAFRFAVAAASSALLNPGTELCHLEDTRRLAIDVVIREL